MKTATKDAIVQRVLFYDESNPNGPFWQFVVGDGPDEITDFHGNVLKGAWELIEGNHSRTRA